MADDAIIEFAGLTVNLGGREILHQLEGELRGAAIGLLGPNGAGKSTLIHTLLGFYSPAAGGARVLGEPIGGRGKARLARLGYMPENDAFVPGLNGVEFVKLMAELAGLPAEAALERAHEALFHAGLGEARYRRVETYSTGMKQSLKLAQAIVHGPRLVFLDEPTNGLDPAARRRMLRLIRELRDGGETRLVLSSHLLRDVEECCDEILILNQGRIAAIRDLEAERKARRGFWQVQLTSETPAVREDFIAGLRRAGREIGELPGGRLRISMPEDGSPRELYALALRFSVQIRRLEPKYDDLETIFLRALEAAPPSAPAVREVEAAHC